MNTKRQLPVKEKVGTKSLNYDLEKGLRLSQGDGQGIRNRRARDCGIARVRNIALIPGRHQGGA